MRCAAEMDDGINAFAGGHNRIHIGQIEGQHLLVRLGIGDRRDIGQTQLARQRREAPAQLGAEAAGGAGDQDGVETRAHSVVSLAGSSAATARRMRATACVSTSSDVAVEMRKKGDRP